MKKFYFPSVITLFLFVLSNEAFAQIAFSDGGATTWVRTAVLAFVVIIGLAMLGWIGVIGFGVYSGHRQANDLLTPVIVSVAIIILGALIAAVIVALKSNINSIT